MENAKNRNENIKRWIKVEKPHFSFVLFTIEFNFIFNPICLLLLFTESRQKVMECHRMTCLWENSYMHDFVTFSLCCFHRSFPRLKWVFNEILWHFDALFVCKIFSLLSSTWVNLNDGNSWQRDSELKWNFIPNSALSQFSFNGFSLSLNLWVLLTAQNLHVLINAKNVPTSTFFYGFIKSSNDEEPL